MQIIKFLFVTRSWEHCETYNEQYSQELWGVNLILGKQEKRSAIYKMLLTLFNPNPLYTDVWANSFVPGGGDTFVLTSFWGLKRGFWFFYHIPLTK